MLLLSTFQDLWNGLPFISFIFTSSVFKILFPSGILCFHRWLTGLRLRYFQEFLSFAYIFLIVLYSFLGIFSEFFLILIFAFSLLTKDEFLDYQICLLYSDFSCDFVWMMIWEEFCIY